MSDRQTQTTSPIHRGLRLVGIAFVVALVALVRSRSGARLPAATTPKRQPSPVAPSASRVAPSLVVPGPVEEREVVSAPATEATASARSSTVEPLTLPSLSPESVATTPVALASSTAATAFSVPVVDERKPRLVLRSAVSAWSTPGLCTSVTEAAKTRETLTSRFRLLELGERGTLYLDPRLPADAELPLLGYLDQAEREVYARLGLRPPRPLTFLYSDQQLMKASACINEDVVAFYDGALHIIAGRPDALASMLHEYTHHALFSVGLIAPTWAHEGIAMHIAKERWWREARFLRALVDNPFGMDDMDRAIPYKLKPEQAVAFYVQSAALVECVLRERRWTLRELFTKLSSGISDRSVSYDIPELDRRSFLSECVGQGLGGVPAGR